MNLSTYKLIDELRSKLDQMKSKTSKAARRLRKLIKKMFRKIGTRTKTYLHTLANQILLVVVPSITRDGKDQTSDEVKP